VNRAATLTPAAPAGTAPAWVRPATPGPGVFRVRPLPGEATASYTARLATAYQLTLPHLLDGLGIHLDPGSANRAAPAAELHFSPTAAARLATHARIPHPHLLQALPRLAPDPHERSAPTGHAPAGPPAAHWQPLEPVHRPVRACTACVLHRSRATTITAWAYPPDHSPALCARHQQAAVDPRHTAPLDIAALPELTRAHQCHLRLARDPAFATALTWAATITTRWYDHHQHLTDRWHTRLNRLTTTNPHTRNGPASPALTCRTLITYPETLTLAAALTRIPPHGLTHNDQPRFLQHLASRLELHHLTPATHDPLWTRISNR
jgi:TniQ